MVDLKKFTNQQVHRYRQRVEEFSDPNAKHCHACQSYVPAKYHDSDGHLICSCGEMTCSRCLRAKPTCTCCVHCRVSRASCTCCVTCRSPTGRCMCTITVTTSSVVIEELRKAFPGAKKCPECPQGWIKVAGCNEGTAHLSKSGRNLITPVTCESCKYNFCWACMREWKSPGCEYYKCTFGR
jgi:hypothetical protein